MTEQCRTEGCTEDPNDGEGWDGYCGSCADKQAIEEGKAQNAKRAGWAENAVNTFAQETFGGRTFTDTVKEQPDERDDAYCMIQDLIGDLLHLAVKHNWDQEEMIERAVAAFDHENDPVYMGD